MDVLKDSAGVFAIVMLPHFDRITDGVARDASSENLMAGIESDDLDLPYFQYGPVMVIGLSKDKLETLKNVHFNARICLYEENGSPILEPSGKPACGSQKLSIPVNKNAFAKISAGDNRTCGLTRIGDVYCWGQNFFEDGHRPDDSMLGLGSSYQDLDYGSPMKVEVPGGKRTIDISVGVTDTYAVSSVRDLFAWGQYVTPGSQPNDYYSSNVPKRIGVATAVDTSLDYPGMYYIGSDGDSVYCTMYSGCEAADDEYVTKASVGDDYRCSIDVNSRLSCRGKIDTATQELEKSGINARIGYMNLENVTDVSVGIISPAP
ncbi:MAG: hypothetical protein IJ523_09330 [Succinivibrionaceae bacterium]|nr:hypothetical protein [Succinivibrionaceae bacterium]